MRRRILTFLRGNLRRIAAALVATMVGGTVLAVVTFFICDGMWPFPMHRLEHWPVAPRVTSVDDRVLLHITGDSQWRSPVPLEAMSSHLIDATVAVEDERYWRHPGVDPLAVVRAIGQNVRAGRVVSGASTISMQVCRMIEPRARTYRAKAWQAFRALQLERELGKEEILEHYLNVAPYGGNVRGVEAAARRYFGTGCKDLTLAEAALLAGLPQAPSRYRPDRHPDIARARRDVVLWRMRVQNSITNEQYRSAVAQPLRLRSVPRETLAPHAAWMALDERPDGGRTTIDLEIQSLAEDVVATADLPRGCHAAVVVIDIEDAAIEALVGSADVTNPVDGQVNGATAWRSPGSVLKTFVYAAAFEEGRLNGESELPDRAMQRRAWRPGNFDGTFRGGVSCAEALRASLNVPAIRVAESIGLERSVGVAEACGLRLPPASRQRGGLAFVTGGVEVRLIDVVNGFATLGRGGVRRAPTLWQDAVGTEPGIRVLSENTCEHIGEILSTRARGDTLSPWFMWKTGTSSRHRDAWAVGHNGRHAVGVWVGRFSGHGSTDLVGARVAEPILAALLGSAQLRRKDLPPLPEPLAVSRPLDFTARSERLRIEEPYEGARIVAVDQSAVIEPTATRDDVQWFLDGRLVTDDRLELGVGQYRLRCVDQNGDADVVAFFVIEPRRRGGS